MKNGLSPQTQKALQLFDEGYACSQAIVLAFLEDSSLNKTDLALISGNFGGGMGRLRRTCGAVTGAFMVLGIKKGYATPESLDNKLASYDRVQQFTDAFEKIHNTSICKELITNHATKEQIKERKHHKFICRKAIEDAGEILDTMLRGEKE